MPSKGFYEWVMAGRPYVDARPVAKIAETLRRHGYTVWTRGDESHMQALTPEDHTPFSVTGWPEPSPRWYGHALDVADPAQTGRPDLPSLADLGAQLFKDKLADVPGARCVKYMNWEPYGASGPCYHDEWEPTHRRTPSTDRGHLHLSIRSDMTSSRLSDDYDPLEALMAITPADAKLIVDTLMKTNLPVSEFWKSQYPDNPGVQDGTVGYDTCVTSGYFHSRQSNERAAAGVPVTLAPEQLAQLTADVTAAVVAQLGALVYKVAAP